MKNTSLLPIYAAIVVTAFLFTFFLSRPEDSADVDDDVLRSGKRLPDFTLVDPYGNKVSLDSFRGKVALIFFGYGNCPDLCPLALQRFAELEQLLNDKASSVVMVFITTDPVRDSPEALKKFVSKYSEKIVALTGDWDELIAVWQKYHVRPIDVNGQSTFIAHSAVIYVADRNLVLQKIFTPETPAEIMLQELKPFL